MPRRIFREEVRRLLREGAQLVEVLPAEEYRARHLPGAISIPLAELSREAPGRLEQGRAVITYCNDFQ